MRSLIEGGLTRRQGPSLGSSSTSIFRVRTLSQILMGTCYLNANPRRGTARTKSIQPSSKRRNSSSAEMSRKPSDGSSTENGSAPKSPHNGGSGVVLLSCCPLQYSAKLLSMASRSSTSPDRGSCVRCPLMEKVGLRLVS